MRAVVAATFLVTLLGTANLIQAAQVKLIDPTKVTLVPGDFPSGFDRGLNSVDPTSQSPTSAHLMTTFTGRGAVVVANLTCRATPVRKYGALTSTRADVHGTGDTFFVQFDERTCSVTIVLATNIVHGKPRVPASFLLRLAHAIDARIRTARATLTIAPGGPPASALYVIVSISPSSTLPYGANARINAASIAGASCSAQVVYSGDTKRAAFKGGAKIVPFSGSVSWNWHEETKSTGGVATVTCSYKGATMTDHVTFSVVDA
jgi:hypothetical protein